MSPINYAAMTDQELKQYFLEHRDDVSAFHAYMDRRYARPSAPGIHPDDPDFEEKLRLAIQQQVNQTLN